VSTHGLNTQRVSAVQKAWWSHVCATILLHEHGPAADTLRMSPKVRNAAGSEIRCKQRTVDLQTKEPWGHEGREALDGTMQDGQHVVFLTRGSPTRAVEPKSRLIWCFSTETGPAGCEVHLDVLPGLERN
jgi:hypothetical protein